MQCASIKKRGSREQCPSKVLFGHTLCGRHARMLHPVLWATANQDKSKAAVCIQKHIRGWLIRLQLSRNGPGVLCRKDVSNTEDLATFEESTRQYPFTYFGFLENGKVWWFDFQTLYRWTLQTAVPINPYTKVPLDLDTRKRMFAVWSYNLRHRIPLAEESTVFEQRLQGRWNQLCHIFSCYGFGDIQPSFFRGFGKVQLYGIFRMMHDDLSFINMNPKVKQRLLFYCHRGMTGIHEAQTNVYLLQSVMKLLVMTTIPHDPYVLLFTMLSAIYRT